MKNKDKERLVSGLERRQRFPCVGKKISTKPTRGRKYKRRAHGKRAEGQSKEREVGELSDLACRWIT